VIVKLENQRQFDKIYGYCQLIFDKKLKPLTKFNLYCQTTDKIDCNYLGSLNPWWLIRH